MEGEMLGTLPDVKGTGTMLGGLSSPLGVRLEDLSFPQARTHGDHHEVSESLLSTTAFFPDCRIQPLAGGRSG